MVVNNVTRFLQAHGIPYQAYELPPEKLGAVETARLLGINPDLVYKTIVIQRERGKPVLAVIPGTHRVDLKLVAAVLGEKKVLLPTERQAEQLTGLQAGGISPLALLHKGFQVILDEAAQQHEQIHISGGQRGLNIRLPVKALLEITRARVARISVQGQDDQN